MKSRRALFLLLALGVVAAVVVWVRAATHYSLSRKLADGTTLRIVQATFGTEFSYHEPKPQPWLLAIGRRLPFATASRLGWWFKGGDWSSVTAPPGETNFALFYTHDGPTTSSASSRNHYHIVLFDEQGNSFDAPIASRGSDGFNPTNTYFHSLEMQAFPLVPRHGKTIGLRFLSDQKDGKGETVIAEFRIPNPNPGPFPRWTPEPLPDVTRAGSVVATLTGFTTGLSRAHPGQAASDNEATITRLGLRLEEPGQSNCSWKPHGIQVSDATGNLWMPDSPASSAEGPAGDAYVMTFSGTLWPGEPAWKLRIELSRTNGFAPEELWTASALPVPAEDTNSPVAPSSILRSSLLQANQPSAGGTNSPPVFSTNINGCSIRLNLARARTSGGRSGPPSSDVTLSVALDQIPNDFRLSLVKVSDEKGRPVKIKSANEWLRWGSSFNLAVPPDATRLECTFAYHQSRFVEFVAAPTR
jgi:hypothetical protein